MPLTNLAVAEEALSLSPAERADLAKLLIQSLEGDRRTDDAIKIELASRLEQLRSGADSGLTFEEIFNNSLSGPFSVAGSGTTCCKKKKSTHRFQNAWPVLSESE